MTDVRFHIIPGSGNAPVYFAEVVGTGRVWKFDLISDTAQKYDSLQEALAKSGGRSALIGSTEIPPHVRTIFGRHLGVLSEEMGAVAALLGVPFSTRGVTNTFNGTSTAPVNQFGHIHGDCS